jgi:hypothetical protein
MRFTNEYIIYTSSFNLIFSHTARVFFTKKSFTPVGSVFWYRVSFFYIIVGIYHVLMVISSKKNYKPGLGIK